MENQQSQVQLNSDVPNQHQLPSMFFSLNTDETIHYLDQAVINTTLKNNDTAVVCVHGNPSWSWYYRHYFHPNQKNRVIAIDHLGMGLSSKVQRYVSIEEHAQNLLKLLEHLKIKKVHLVMHDWGGIIGILALKDSSQTIKSIIGMNTSFFPRKNFPWRIFLTTRPTWNNFLNKKLGVFSRAAGYMTTHHVLSGKNRAAYQYPYQYDRDRQGIVNFLQEIPWFEKSQKYGLLQECEKFIQRLSVPMLAIWGLKDFCFDESYLNYWKNICPQLEVAKFYDGGHWIFEDKTHEVLELSENFWSNL
jgi:pimeloyl-ACP methyl ester carboxylesterase